MKKIEKINIKNLKIREGYSMQEIFFDDYDQYSYINGKRVELGENNRVIEIVDKYGDLVARLQITI